jgi:hypothetical protein
MKVFGSKWSSAKHYPQPIEGAPLFEPFAGSAGYSLNYHWFPVTINEIDFDLAFLWSWIIDVAKSQDILDIPLNVPEGTDIRSLGLSQGQATLLKYWQRTNNWGGCWTISKWGHLPGQFTESTRSRVAEQIHAVKHWKLNPIVWNIPGTYACDPPYLYNYRYGCNDFDFSNYSQKVLALPPGSMAICSEARCPKTGRVPDYLPFTDSHSQVTSRRKTTNNHHSRELVFIHRT